MPFDILEGLPDGLPVEDKRRYEEALVRAQRLLEKIPFVRTFGANVGRAASSEASQNSRGEHQLEDFWFHGVFEEDHESAATREHEKAFGRGPFVYFHGGRPHLQYGDCVVVLKRMERSDLEVTPFGLFNITDQSPKCDASAYLHPVVTLPLLEKKHFLDLNSWKSNDWCKLASKYLAFYLDGNADSYFCPNGACPLLRRQTALGQAIWSEPTGDWRAWTLEIRIPPPVKITSGTEIMYLVITKAAQKFLKIKTKELSRDTHLDSEEGRAYLDFNFKPQYAAGPEPAIRIAEELIDAHIRANT